MRKLLYLLLFVSVYAYGQKTDEDLTTQGNQIRNETTAGANTAVRIGTMFNDLTLSKVNKRTPLFLDSADITKRIKFQLSGLTTGTTRTVTWPNKSGTVAFLDDISVGGDFVPKHDTAAIDIKWGLNSDSSMMNLSKWQVFYKVTGVDVYDVVNDNFTNEFGFYPDEFLSFIRNDFLNEPVSSFSINRYGLSVGGESARFTLSEGLFLGVSGTFTNIKADSITANRTIYLPDASGKFALINNGALAITSGADTESVKVSEIDGASTLVVNNGTRSVNIAGLLPKKEVAVNTTVDASYVANCLQHTGPSAIDVTIPSTLQENAVITFLQRSTGAINLVEGANVQIEGKVATTGAWDMIWLYLVYKSGGTSYYVGR
jgi:hypothetical protein